MNTVIPLFLIGIVAGFVSGMIGGGSGLILVPAQILLGIDPRIATTTTHFGFIGVSLGAMARFNQEREIKGKSIIPLTVIALISGVLGPYLLFSIDAKAFQQILGVLILICVPLFLLKKNLGTSAGHAVRVRPIIGYFSLFVIFTLQVAFGAATGIIAIFALVYFFGLSMIETSAALRLPNLVSSLIGLIIYARHGTVNFGYGFTLLVAMILGGYIGSHVAIKGGNDFVKYLFATLASIVAATLLFHN